MTRSVHRAVVAGSGSIARRHLANLRTLLPSAELAMVPTRPASPPPPVVASVDATWLTDTDDATTWDADLAVIATPAGRHLDVAERFGRRGTALFVEKPLTLTRDAADAFVDLVGEIDVPVDVGYCLRSSPSVVALESAVRGGVVGRVLGVRAEVGQSLDTWRPDVDRRGTVSADEELGGGVVFELSHELDYLSWILGPPTLLAAELRRLGGWDPPVTDTAELLLGWGDVVGSVHLDMVRRPAARSCTVWGDEGTLRWDGDTRTLTLAEPSGAETTLHGPGEHPDDMYVAELANFVDCIGGTASPRVTVAEARDVVDLCTRARTGA